MTIDRRFKKGIELFNRRKFFECHEVIEGLWLETEDEYKELYKGVIQAAVALHHLSRGNLTGANELHQTSQNYLKRYVPAAQGLDVEKLLKDMKICFQSHKSGRIIFPHLEFKE